MKALRLALPALGCAILAVAEPAPPPSTGNAAADALMQAAPRLTAPVITKEYKKLARPRTITGEVFLRMNDGSKRSLPGVKVCVYPFPVFSAFYDWRNKEGGAVSDYVRKKITEQPRNGDAGLFKALVHLVPWADHHSWDYLPEPVASAVTDAAGRYKLQHDSDDQNLIVAMTQFETGPNQTEYLFWAVYETNVDGNGQLLLQNNNLGVFR